ncbi:unnamed protein product [Lactuca saligna]|uniref:Cation-transporting P-type ATPase C-terminal domain-containing protein n=1 Tax=Lactuca saligna TaxID=75948 RepID=A0AA35YNJ6_LACSI|nr:unnamed protein product [Lactuca saligna]
METLISNYRVFEIPTARPEVKEAVEICLAVGITVCMVTGDNINTTRAIANECGILTEGGLAIEGPVFRAKSTAKNHELAPRIQVMARLSPTDQLKFVEHLWGLSEVVAVTVDGTNDAPTLHESDIGFAMGITGTKVAKEQADVIVLDDDFETIIKVAKWGRAVYLNIQKFVQFQLTVNIVALMINFVSACITESAPLTTMQLLWVNLIMDTLGALALATEPPNDGLMNKPPVFNEVNSRDIHKINVFHGMLSSWIFVSVMVSTVVFQVIILEFLGTFASTVPLDLELWALSIAIELGLITLMDSELENPIGATFEEDLDKMLPKCDIIVINTPLTEKTRWGIVEMIYFWCVLGYSGDIWYPQPAPKDHPWRYMPNQAMTPHIYGTIVDAHV